MTSGKLEDYSLLHIIHTIIGDNMAVAERKTLNNQLASFMKSDRNFIDGIKRGVKDCKEGRVQLWEEVKKELNIK